MKKAKTFPLICAALLALALTANAQTSAQSEAVQRALLNQQSTILLRQKLAEARVILQRGDNVGAAKLYQESYQLTQQIGQGIDAETRQAKEGLATTRLVLARDAQSRGDYRGADTQVKQVLLADPKNAVAVRSEERRVGKEC